MVNNEHLWVIRIDNLVYNKRKYEYNNRTNSLKILDKKAEHMYTEHMFRNGLNMGRIKSIMSGIQETVSTNRKYKDRLFRLRFGSEEYKADVLCLYNAINETTNT